MIWLPTYLSRENPDLEILTPAELAHQIADKTTFAELDETLIAKIQELRAKNRLILAMSAGSLDGFVRENL